MSGQTLCILGCGNLGTPILQSLITTPSDSQANKFSKFIACVHSENSSKRLSHLLHEHTESGKLVITRGDNVEAVQNAYVVILAVDPSQVEATLKQDVLAQALKGKLLISVAAGWSRENLERLLVDANAPEKDEERRIWILHTLPNILAQVSQSLTAIEDPTPAFPPKYLEIADAIFSQIGKTMRITPRLMPATTVVSGSTPAFFAIICDASIDAAHHGADADIPEYAGHGGDAAEWGASGGFEGSGDKCGGVYDWGGYADGGDGYEGRWGRR